MMGERLVMQESLFYEFRLEDHCPVRSSPAEHRPLCGLLRAASTPGRLLQLHRTTLD